MASKATKAAWSAVAETCPEVDSAFYDLRWSLEELLPELPKGEEMDKLFDLCKERVKAKTSELREALINAYEEMYSLDDEWEEKLSEMEEEHRREVSNLEDVISDLEYNARDGY